jgi:hypothetical protein
MGRRNAAAPIEPVPTPTPASAERPTTATNATADQRTAFRHRFGVAFTKVIEGMDVATQDEISQRYGGNPDLELADIKAGCHPMQRGGRNLDAYSKYEAKLATIRAKLAR